MNTRPIRLAPSILAADFTQLGAQVLEIEKTGADRCHVDVMDGHFVPNISFGPVVQKAIRRITRLPIETHLMISNPDDYLEAFVDAGSDALLVHYEGAIHLHRTIQRIKSLGKRAGVVINPATPAVAIEEVVRDVDTVLVMTVNPGFGGQEFIRETLDKITRIRALLDRVHPACELEVDGGVDVHSAPLARAAGACTFVAGSSIFGAKDGVPAAMKRLVDSMQ